MLVLSIYASIIVKDEFYEACKELVRQRSATLDLSFAESANVIWKHIYQLKRIPSEEADMRAEYHVKSALFKMAAIKRIPVSPEILEVLSRLKEPEQTFGELIAGMIERENKFWLLKDMKRIEETADFVEIQGGPRSYKQRCSKIRGFAY